jgi:hypothetical protein
MRKRGWALILLLGAAFGVGLIATSLGRGAQAPVERIYFSVLDKDEKPVLGLKAADFELRVDGTPATLEGFHAGLPYTDRSVPLVAWILLDFGATMESSVIKKQADAAAGAFDMLHPASVIGVKLVSDRSETMAPLAHNPAALRNAFIQYEQRRAELNVGIRVESVPVGEAGIARALEVALDEMDRYVAAQPMLRDREVHRAAMIISNANLNPSYNLKPFYAKATREGLFLYPVFYVARASVGPGIDYYFALAKKTAGVAAVLGALRPGSEINKLLLNNQGPNALTVNFVHMIRDINGKYSFTLPSPPAGQQKHLKLTCKAKGVRIRLVRTSLP